jgi:S1-C subfamily serine protease
MSTYDDRDRYPPRQPAVPSLWPFLVLLVVIILVGIGAFAAWRFWHPPQQTLAELDVQPKPVVARGALAPLEQTNIDIYNKTRLSVVHVTNLAERRDYFNLNVQTIPRGTGTGFIWDEHGIVVTNYHVVQGADVVEVILADKARSSYQTRSWVVYPDKDMAVVWINDAPKEKLHPLQLGRSDDLKVGQLAYAIGNPFGLDQTMTMGIISALNREIETDTDHRPIQGAIQISAAINPGNSGGPLLDSAGLLIGMNTAILSPSGAFAGIGFAIPVEDINRAVPKMIEVLKQNQGQHSEVAPPRLGVQIADKQLAEELGVQEGVLIIHVLPGSPAAKAGLHSTRRRETGHIQLGDIIVGIDGKEVKTVNDLNEVLANHKIGDTVKLTVIRDGKQQDVNVTLTALPQRAG